MAGGTRTVSTDAAGLATWQVSGLPWTHEAHWFRGRVSLTVALPQDGRRELTALGDEAATETLTLPQAEGTSAPLTLPGL